MPILKLEIACTKWWATFRGCSCNHCFFEKALIRSYQTPKVGYSEHPLLNCIAHLKRSNQCT